MSLYEDEELGAPPASVAVGWSKGVKLMQSHIQLKKAAAKTIPDIHPGSNLISAPSKPRPVGQVLAPVIDLKTKQKIVEEPSTVQSSLPPIRVTKNVSHLLMLIFSENRTLNLYNLIKDIFKFYNELVDT